MSGSIFILQPSGRLCEPCHTSKQKDRPKAVSAIVDYILSSVFFIFVDFDLAIFFLLILSFDISPFDMLSLWAAGPVVAGPFVSVD
jgi:NADH:ubiquinone oxidoreductase subunit 3 (subunit A)